MHFKEFLNERKLSGWNSGMGSFYLSCDMSNVKKCLISLLTSEFGAAKGAGTGSANSVANASPNKYLNFSWGFSEANMGMYLRLNNKDFKEKDLFNIFTKHGKRLPPDEDEYMGMYLSFGKYAMMYNSEPDDRILIIEKDDIKDELIDMYLDMDYTRKEASKYISDFIKSLK